MSTPDTETTVQVLERKVQSLRDQLGAAEKSLHQARLVASGLVPQITILLYKGKEYRFTGVRTFTITKKPWVYAQQKNKNGAWSERETLLYDNWSIK
jgi:hypothetical protein